MRIDLLATAATNPLQIDDDHEVNQRGRFLVSLASPDKETKTAAPRQVTTEVKEVNTTMKATIDVDWEIAIRKAYGQTESGLNTPAERASKTETVVDVEEVKL